MCVTPDGPNGKSLDLRSLVEDLAGAWASPTHMDSIPRYSGFSNLRI